MVSIAVMGFLLPGIDNWAHLGGFVGGYLAARVLDPLKPERGARGGDLTLLFSARDTEHNNAVALRMYLIRSLKQRTGTQRSRAKPVSA